MDERLQKQLDFALEIDKEKNIFRQTHLSGHGRNENDAEHAWHIHTIFDFCSMLPVLFFLQTHRYFKCRSALLISMNFDRSVMHPDNLTYQCKPETYTAKLPAS